LPFTASSVNLESPCEEYAARQKHAKYDASFRGTAYMFAALVFETTGAINEEGQSVLRQLFRFAALRLGKEFSSFCGRAWTRSRSRSLLGSMAWPSLCSPHSARFLPATPLSPSLVVPAALVSSARGPPPGIPTFSPVVSLAPQ